MLRCCTYLQFMIRSRLSKRPRQLLNGTLQDAVVAVGYVSTTKLTGSIVRRCEPRCSKRRSVLRHEVTDDQLAYKVCEVKRSVHAQQV